MEGKGFEPTVDALFGKNGFFPDTVLKTMYVVSDNMPLRVQEILQNMVPTLKTDRMKKQVLRAACFVNINTKNMKDQSFIKVKLKNCDRVCIFIFRPPRT